MKTVSETVHYIGVATKTLTAEQKYLVRKLTELGYGMLDCKKALIENNWDIAKSKLWLAEHEELIKLTSLVTKRK